jgi:hypothetical protein
LDTHNILTLATIREDGYPQTTTVGYVHEGLTLYIGTFPQAQKVANIRRCPKVSLTIDRDYDDWGQIKGLSMGGTADILTDPEDIRRVGALFTAKFPQLAALPAPLDPANVVLVKITPASSPCWTIPRGLATRNWSPRKARKLSNRPSVRIAQANRESTLLRSLNSRLWNACVNGLQRLE